MPKGGGRLGVIFLTVLIDLIGFGIVIPILPYFAQEFGAHGLGLGVLMGSFSGMQFAATTILGRLSDRVGRRPVLLVTIALNAAGYVLFANARSFAVLLAARLVSGFAGGNMSVAQAYVADVTTPAQRSRGMGVIGMAFGLGFIIGPSIGGLAGHYWGHAAPGYVAAALSLVNLVLAARILPESLHEGHRTRRSLWGLGHIGEGLANPRLGALLLLWLMVPIAFAGYTTVLPLYANVRFGWTTRELGWFFTVVGIVAAVVQGWAFGRLATRFGDRRLLIVGTWGMALSIAVVPFLPNPAWLYVWTGALAFSNSIVAPAVSGMVSVLAEPNEQGTMLGVAQSLGALGRLTGPELDGAVYDASGARAAFLLAGAIMAIAALVAARVPRRAGHAPPAAPVL